MQGAYLDQYGLLSILKAWEEEKHGSPPHPLGDGQPDRHEPRALHCSEPQEMNQLEWPPGGRVEIKRGACMRSLRLSSYLRHRHRKIGSIRLSHFSKE